MTFRVTDLDGTLIFTSPAAPGLREVERFPSGRAVHMHENAFVGLKELADTGDLLVATSRTVSQFRHAALPPLPYVLAANGLDLIEHGHVMAEWRDEQCQLLSIDAEPWVRLQRHCEDMFNALGLRQRVHEPWLAACVGERAAVADCQFRLQPAVSEAGWKTVAVGRKLYVLPKGLDKQFTVGRALRRIGQRGYVAAGDSAMDLGMLRAAQRALVPLGSDLATASITSMTLTRASGPAAGPEIIDWFRTAAAPH